MLYGVKEVGSDKTELSAVEINGPVRMGDFVDIGTETFKVIEVHHIDNVAGPMLIVTNEGNLEERYKRLNEKHRKQPECQGIADDVLAQI